MASKKKHEPSWFPRDYWDRPPLRDEGEQSPGPIYHAVGQALTAWENAEQALADFFIVLTEPNTATVYNAVRRAYGSIESNTGRRKAVDAVAEIYFGSDWNNEKIKRPYNELMEHIRQASTRRDDIAHGHVMGITINERNHGHFLLPVEYNNSRTYAFTQASDALAFTREYYRYVSKDITDFTVKFQQLQKAIVNFMLSINKRDGRIPLLDAHNPTIRQAI